MALVLIRAAWADHPVTRSTLNACRYRFEPVWGLRCFVVNDSLLPVCIMAVPMAVKAFLALPAEFRSREDEASARPRDVAMLDDHEEVMAMATKLAPVTPGELLLEAFSRPMGVSQYRLAKVNRVPSTRVSEIVSGRRSITADADRRLCWLIGPQRGDWSRAQAANDYVAHDTKVAYDRLAGKLGRVRPRATAEEALCADVGVNLTVHPAGCRMRPARHPPKRSRPILMP